MHGFRAQEFFDSLGAVPIVSELDARKAEFAGGTDIRGGAIVGACISHACGGERDGEKRNAVP
jgi:hypothetical protein